MKFKDILNSFLLKLQVIGAAICFIWLRTYNIQIKSNIEYYLLIAGCSFCIGVIYNLFKLNKRDIKNNFKRYFVIFSTSLLSVACIGQVFIDLKILDSSLVGGIMGGFTSLVSILFALYKFIENEGEKKQWKFNLILKKGIYKKDNQYHISNEVNEFSIKLSVPDLHEKISLLGFCLCNKNIIKNILDGNKGYDNEILDWHDYLYLSNKTNWQPEFIDSNKEFNNISACKLRSGLNLSSNNKICAVFLGEDRNIKCFPFYLD